MHLDPAQTIRRTLIGCLTPILLAVFSSTLLAATPFVHQTVETSGDVGSYMSMALDSDGRAHMAYYDASTTDLIYAFWESGFWIAETVDNTDIVGQWTSIAVDDQGRPHISYQQVDSGSLRYAVKDAGVWTIETVDGLNITGLHTSIDLDSKGQPHIAYYELTGGNLKYARKLSGVWTISTQVSINDSGKWCSLALDADDGAHFSYYDDTNDDLRHTSNTKSGTSNGLVDGGGNVGEYSSIQVDGRGFPHISYRDATNFSLKHAYRDGTVWIKETVDGTDDAGFYTSLAMGPRGDVHISYHRAGNENLYYASKNAGWTIEAVNVFGRAGQGTAIDLHKEGAPVIAHYEGLSGDALLEDAGIQLVSPLGGDTWPVGSLQTIQWDGAGEMNLYLSVDGGSSYEPLVTSIFTPTNPGGGTHEFRVPHQPSRFCLLKLERAVFYATAVTDSFFTIEASISLLNMSVQPGPEVGLLVSWETDPGPEDLGGYRLERTRGGDSWTELLGLTRETSFHDTGGRPGDRYRLFAINGLGESYLLGEATDTSLPAGTVLSLWPNPYRSGDLTIFFATAGGLGGGTAPVRVDIYDVRGRLVREVLRGDFPAGTWTRVWDGRDQNGDQAPSGIYFVRSRSGSEISAAKLIKVN